MMHLLSLEKIFAFVVAGAMQAKDRNCFPFGYKLNTAKSAELHQSQLHQLLNRLLLMGSSKTQNKALLVQSRKDPSASLRAGLGLANARPKVWR